MSARSPRRPRTRRPRTRSKRRVPRRVFSFGAGQAQGHKGLKNLLGGKGANLAEMSRLGLPVPPGFTISTEVCTHFQQHDGAYPVGLEERVADALAAIEKSVGRRFGDAERPLLVSVRSGARVSMPGMMDTVLNLGLNDYTVAGLARESGNERFAWDAYRRFVQMYSDVVLGVRAAAGEEVSPFSAALDALKKKRRVTEDTELDARDLEGLVRTFKGIVKQRLRREFPDDPREQLWGAIGAVFGSWNNERAIAYRAMNQIPHDWGTAVTVMAMVFGNLGKDSGTGVAFTRDPATGEKRFYGEYLMNAQGEDVVAGLRTPMPISRLAKSSPEAYRELQRIQKLLEDHYRDMQDLEFTIEHGKLYMLQCRAGKRTGFAAVRIAVDMVREKRISPDEALLRVDPEALNQLLQPVFDAKQLRAAKAAGRFLTRGLNAGPGAASGHVVFNAEVAARWAAEKQGPVILARLETSPEDIRGMQASVGILTARGGTTSHAALVARQMGRVCVAGAGEIEIDSAKRRMRVGGRTFREGDWISLDGTSGDVIEGHVDTQPSEVVSVLFGKRGGKANRTKPTFKAFSKLMTWADRARTLEVRANADQADQCEVALTYGAKGIGLCRTEHMFFEGHKIDAVREMILAEDADGRARALKKLLPLQRKDFEGIFMAMAPHPVTIRTLDPPLHEFLPHDPGQIRALAKDMGVSAAKVKAKVEALAELNPMLGHRGCRLGIVYPEITRMQARAIFEAACNVKRKRKTVKPEIMIPLVGSARELELQEAVVREIAEQVFAEKQLRVPYLVGTMIELPRAALVADEIAKHAEFFSFGTNDLTQTTFGISRDDAGGFVPYYVNHDVLECDPFISLDTAGVGALMRIAAEKGRATQPGIKLGICGEHGGDPRSIEFCQALDLEYVSCSPHRLPIARLAAAQAALRQSS